MISCPPSPAKTEIHYRIKSKKISDNDRPIFEMVIHAFGPEKKY